MNQNLIEALIFVSDFTLVVGGWRSGDALNTIEVLSPNPLSNEVPNCIKTLGNFPTTINGAVGTTFGKLKGKWILYDMGRPYIMNKQ